MKVLIFGLGLNEGGVGSAKFFAKLGAQVKVTDLKNETILKPSLEQLKDFPITYTLGKHKNEDINWADLIIKNPGVKPKNPYIEYAKSKGKKVEQDMGIFLGFVKPSQIVGVTGTKGKSTTSSLIYEVLKNSGKKVILAGNIGTSVLDIIQQIQSDTLIVLEISSFQLEAFDQHKVSPHFAVITNIYPDHLNYYKNMDEYIGAKKVIGKYQTENDYLFINHKNKDFAEGLKSKIIYYSNTDLPANFKSSLVGEHNKSNMAAAYVICKKLGVDEKIILKTISQFKGVPFRIQLIKDWSGIKIINDTTATTPDAAIQAIKTFPNSILICGGMNKGMNYKQFVTIVKKCVKKIYFLEGDSTEMIKKLMKNQNIIAGTYNDLEKLLIDVKEIVKNGDTILFSPGATSFNLFQNEFDRGRQFNEAVQKVFADA